MKKLLLVLLVASLLGCGQSMEDQLTLDLEADSQVEAEIVDIDRTFEPAVKRFDNDVVAFNYPADMELVYEQRAQTLGDENVVAFKMQTDVGLEDIGLTLTYPNELPVNDFGDTFADYLSYLPVGDEPYVGSLIDADGYVAVDFGDNQALFYHVIMDDLCGRNMELILHSDSQEDNDVTMVNFTAACPYANYEKALEFFELMRDTIVYY